MEENQITIPDGWHKIESINHLGKILNGLSGKKKEDFGEGEPFITYVNVFKNSRINDEEVDFVRIKKGEYQNKTIYGDLIFTTSSETIKEVGMTSVFLGRTKSFYLNSFCFIFRLNDFKVLLPEFVQYLFRSDSVRYNISLLGQGSTRYNLSKTRLLKELKLVVPKSIKEQQSIAAILSKIDEAIAQTEALIAKYNRIKTGLMQDLLTKGIDENGNIRSEATHEFKDSPLGRIPKEWDVVKLFELSLKIGDGTHSSVNFSDNDEVPFLFVSCIRPNKIDWTKITSISLDEYKKISKGKEPKAGTVLYSLVGSYGNAVTLQSDDKLSFQRHIGFIETKRDILLPEFLTLFFNSVYGNLQANDLAVGNAQKTITLGALKEFKILKPTIDEQNLIIAKFSIIETHLSKSNTELSKLKSIKTGLMKDLLSGRVRVKGAELLIN